MLGHFKTWFLITLDSFYYSVWKCLQNENCLPTEYQVIFPGIFATFWDFFLSVLAGNCTAGLCNVLQAIHENVRDSYLELLFWIVNSFLSVSFSHCMCTSSKVIIHKSCGEVSSNEMCVFSLFKIYIYIFKQNFVVFSLQLLSADATIFKKMPMKT